MTTQQATFERRSDLLHRRVTGGLLVSRLTEGEPVRLDGVGAFLFDELATQKTWDELSASLDSIYGEVWRAETDAVAGFLAELVDIGLILQEDAADESAGVEVGLDS